MELFVYVALGIVAFVLIGLSIDFPKYSHKMKE